MTETHSSGADHTRRKATPSATNGAHPLASATHALAERLTAMTHYFSAARGNLDKGNIEAAEQLFSRSL